MGNRLTFFIFIYMVAQTFSLFMEGEVSIVTTTLSVSTSETATTLTVVNTNAFESVGFVTIGNEDICYTGKTSTTFTGLTRGCHNTEATGHGTVNSNGVTTRVYNETTGLMNQVIGFDLLQVLADDGFLRAGYRAFTSLPELAKGIGKIVIWDYGYLEGQMVWLRYLLFALSAAMVIDFVNLILRRGGS